jgi:hypothetical protein
MLLQKIVPRVTLLKQLIVGNRMVDNGMRLPVVDNSFVAGFPLISAANLNGRRP